MGVLQMPTIRVGPKNTEAREGEIVVDVRKKFEDTRDNAFAVQEAEPYVLVVVAALNNGFDVLITCNSGLARSPFVAYLTQKAYTGANLELDVDMDYVKSKREMWFDPNTQQRKKQRAKKS
jgi:hypothetical protein